MMDTTTVILLSLLLMSHVQFYFERKRLLDRIMAKNLSDLVLAEAERLGNKKQEKKTIQTFEV